MFKLIKKIFTYPILSYKPDYKRLNPKNYSWNSIKNGLKIFVIFMAGVTLTIFSYQLIFMESDDETSDYIAGQVIAHLDKKYFSPEGSPTGCNLKIIELTGELVSYIPNQNISDQGNMMVDETSSSYILREIKAAESNDTYKAFIFEIDSSGGYAVAADEVASALKNAKKPNAALIRESGLSAAYYGASAADIIFANKNSDVGSIGVSASYLDYSKKNEQEGLTYVELTTGKFKDSGSPDKPLTAEEKELILRDSRILHENFVKTVAENRNLDIVKVRKMADGSSMLGEAALKNGLVDRLGGMDDAIKYLEEKVGEKLSACR